MPVQFICPRCNQLLSVGSRKIGSEVACPRCQSMVVVPTHEVAAVGVAMRQSLRSQASEAETAAEFTVFDDIPAVLETETDVRIETSPARRSQTEPPPPARAKRRETPLWGLTDESDNLPTPMLLLSRRAVYWQAALLGAVAVVAFLAGLLIGRGVAPATMSGATQEGPINVQGVVRSATGGNASVDVGAVVLALPEGKTPTPKIPLQGLRPGEQPVQASQASLAAIGGATARTGGDGSYQLQLPQPGQYLFLVISNQAERPENVPVEEFQLALMKRYFDRPEDLIGRKQYLWKVENVRGPVQLDHTFTAAGE